MPASMPDAMEAGMRAISRVSGLNRPVAIRSSAVSTKAPTASLTEKPVLAAINAAPGVDHAVTIGMRKRQDRTAVSSAIAKQSAVTALAVCAWFAPTA